MGPCSGLTRFQPIGKRAFFGLLSAAALLWLLPVPAAAQYRFAEMPAEIFADEDIELEDRGMLWGEFVSTVGTRNSEATFAMSPALGATYHVIPPMEVEAKWGFVALSTPTGLGDHVAGIRPGNPFFGTHWMGTWGPWHTQFGVGMSPPLASQPSGNPSDPGKLRDHLLASDGARYAAGMRGDWNAWMWEPDRLTFVAPSVRLKRIAGWWIVAAETQTAISLWTGETRRATSLIVQAALDLARQMTSRTIVGMRAQGVLRATEDELDDRFQSSLEAYLRRELGRAFVVGRVLVNLDEPYGFGSDAGPIWSVNLGGGTVLGRIEPKE